MVGNGTMIGHNVNMSSCEHHGIVFNRFDSRTELVDVLKAETLLRLEGGVQQHGAATWAVSGGSTPAPLFKAMTDTPFCWDKIDVALVDERWVNADHPRSNERFIQNTLMQGHVAAARLTGMYRDTVSPHDALGDVEATYGALSKPFANVLLGLGNDGHTASLFPSAEGLEAALAPDYFALCAAINAKQSDVTGEETLRMSLTLNALKEANSCFLMITGDEKLATLKSALDNNMDLPITRVVDALKRPLEVFWAP